MKTDRLLSLVRSIMQRSIESGDIEMISRQLSVLLQLEHDRRMELEKELTTIRLENKYGRRKEDK